MGLKSAIKSRNGQAAVVVTLLTAMALALAGGFLWWGIFSREADADSIEGQLRNQASSWNAADVQVIAEDEPLNGLPSETVSYLDRGSEESDSIGNHALGLPWNVLDGVTLESLLNVNASLPQEDGATATGTPYDFKFYSGSLNDYARGGVYETAVKQFLALDGRQLASVSFDSRPTAAGGRLVTVNVKANFEFSETKKADAERIWNNSVRAVSETANFEDGTLVSLTLQDNSKVTLKTELRNQSDVETAANLNDRLWSTFGIYGYGSTFNFLSIEKVSYSVERTAEDSVMTLTVADGLRSNPADAQERIWGAVRAAKGSVYLPGSYITYLVSEGNSSPMLTLDSSSRS